jgi:hypothetical protein
LLCGHTDVVLVESRNVRSFRNRLNPLWDAHVRVAEACSKCGSRSFVMHGNVAQES